MKRLKGFFVIAAVVAMLASHGLFSGLSAKEKAAIPSPDDSAFVDVGAKKIQPLTHFFDIASIEPTNCVFGTEDTVRFKWKVDTVATLPYGATCMTYIFLNGRKWGLFQGVPNQFSANVYLAGEYEWQVLIGLAWDGGSHLDSSSVKMFKVGDYAAMMQKATITPNESPTAYAIAQNYPNPFNPTSHIEYSVPKSGHVSLKVFNTLGEEVATIFDGEQLTGKYIATFEGKGLPSGVYFYRLQSGGVSLTQKLVLMK